MLPLLSRRLMSLKKKEALRVGILGEHTVDKLFLAHPAPDPVPKRGLEAALEKEDPIILPAPCPAVQSLTPIPLDLGLDPTLHLRRGIVLINLKVVQAPHPVLPLGLLPRCPAPLPEGGGGSHIPPLVQALGVARDHALGPLTGELSGAEPEDCTGAVYESCLYGW